MNEEMTQQLVATAERLAMRPRRWTASSDDSMASKKHSMQRSTGSWPRWRNDWMTPARDHAHTDLDNAHTLQQRVADLEKTNNDLKAQATRLARKTLPPLVIALLSKNGEAGDRLEAAALDKTLQSLTVDQRIAVKAEMARAGMIE